MDSTLSEASSDDFADSAEADAALLKAFRESRKPKRAGACHLLGVVLVVLAVLGLAFIGLVMVVREAYVVVGPSVAHAYRILAHDEL